MKHYKKYISVLNADKDILETYRDLRKAFQREGWTEKDLEKPPYYPKDIMGYFQEFSSEHQRLFNEIRMYFNIDHNEFVDYLKESMKHIDDELPLDNK